MILRSNGIIASTSMADRDVIHFFKTIRARVQVDEMPLDLSQAFSCNCFFFFFFKKSCCISLETKSGGVSKLIKSKLLFVTPTLFLSIYLLLDI